MDLLNQLKEVITTNADKHLSENNLYTPAFYKVTKLKEAESLLKLLSQKPNIKIYDNIASQLKELVKSRKPNLTLNDVEIAKEIELTLNGTNLEEFGTWVYYPWNEKIVHILDEDDFIELRTSRNKYKITEEERKTLALKKIGVIGLSVGQSVSLTLAMERCFGELRIADFDELDLEAVFTI
jgi:hypothetical protein